MPRIRFQGLMAFLHVVDPATDTPGDKLRKVESFVNYFKSRFVALYHSRKQVAVDERMVRSRHRSGIRQYTKDKPIKWGIKLWEVADSSNDYTVDINIYIGKDVAREISKFRLGHDVVVRLTSPYYNQGYHLFIDNLYTSVHLIKHLFQHGVIATGTILQTRKDMPENFKKGSEWGKNKARGTMRWQRDPPYLILQWVDSKVVSMISTTGNANNPGQVKHRVKTADGVELSRGNSASDLCNAQSVYECCGPIWPDTGHPQCATQMYEVVEDTFFSPYWHWCCQQFYSFQRSIEEQSR